MTDRYALIGTPIDRSPSPAMHNAAFAATGLDAHYVLRSIDASGVERVMAQLQREHWRGLNVTTPLKTVLPGWVDLDDDSRRAGAVNTVGLHHGRAMGWLTDVAGVQEPLADLGVAGGEGIIIGAGGAARAAVLALERLGVKVHVAARRPDAARAVLAEVGPADAGEAWRIDDLGPVFGRAGVIIQATGVGRQGERFDLPWDHLAKGCVAFEMNYLPRRTPFLEDASAAGARVIEGWRMLLAQGAHSFQRWTGLEPPVPVMEDALLNHLEAHADG